MAYKSRLTRDKQAQIKTDSDVIEVNKTIVNGEEVYTIETDDLDKLSEVYDVSDGQPVIKDKDGNVVIIKDSNGNLQILHADGSQQAILIGEDGRIILRAKNNSDGPGGYLILSPRDSVNPEVRIGYSENMTNEIRMKLQKGIEMQFNTGSNTKKLRVENQGFFIDFDEITCLNFTTNNDAQNPDGVFEMRNEIGKYILSANRIRTILYHNGVPIIYVNPTQENAEGEQTEPYFLLTYPNNETLLEAPKPSGTGEDFQLLLGARIKELIGKKALLNLSIQRFEIAANARVDIKQYLTPLINKMWGDTILTAPFAGVATIHADIQAIDATGQNAGLVAYIGVNEENYRWIKGIITSSTSTSIRINFMEVVELNEGDEITIDLSTLNQSITIDANSRINVQLQQYNE